MRSHNQFGYSTTGVLSPCTSVPRATRPSSLIKRCCSTTGVLSLCTLYHGPQDLVLLKKRRCYSTTGVLFSCTSLPLTIRLSPNLIRNVHGSSTCTNILAHAMHLTARKVLTSLHKHSHRRTVKSFIAPHPEVKPSLLDYAVQCISQPPTNSCKQLLIIGTDSLHVH